MTDNYKKPDADDLKARLRELRGTYGVGDEAANCIEQLEDALTQPQTEVAAAYERAADSVRRLEDGWHDGVSAEYHQHSSAQMKLYAIREIRALATPDQTSALDTIRAETREQGMREAAAIALQRKGDGVATLDHPYDKGYLAACDTIAKSILVAITKGAKA